MYNISWLQKKNYCKSQLDAFLFIELLSGFVFWLKSNPGIAFSKLSAAEKIRLNK